MKVVFLEHVINVAKPGDIKDVKTGYALHELIPKGLAKKLTPELEKQLQNRVRKQDQNRIALASEQEEIIQKLEGYTLKMTLRGDSTKVYGSISEKDILPYINKHTGVTLSKKHIVFPNGQLKNLGEHAIHVKLSKHHVARIIVDIQAK